MRVRECDSAHVWLPAASAELLQAVPQRLPPSASITPVPARRLSAFDGNVSARQVVQLRWSGPRQPLCLLSLALVCLGTVSLRAGGVLWYYTWEVRCVLCAAAYRLEHGLKTRVLMLFGF